MGGGRQRARLCAPMVHVDKWEGCSRRARPPRAQGSRCQLAERDDPDGDGRAFRAADHVHIAPLARRYPALARPAMLCAPARRPLCILARAAPHASTPLVHTVASAVHHAWGCGGPMRWAVGCVGGEQGRSRRTGVRRTVRWAADGSALGCVRTHGARRGRVAHGAPAHRVLRDLSDNSLTGTIPTEMGGLSALRSMCTSLH